MATRGGGPAAAAAPILLLLLGFLFLLRGVPSRAEDTVAAGQPLSGGQSLVSKRGKFRLGFFQPDNSTQRWYLGIWYNQISVHTTVWVANRVTPISDPESSQLSISSDRNMVILDHSSSRSTVVWSTNVTTGITSNSTVGVILDNGNLVLADASNTSAVLWQSFDHFGDTWLPGGKLGRNKLTGEVTRLVAWKGYNDPTPSLFALELDPRGSSQYLLNWNGSEQYWSSGNWTGTAFAAVPEMTSTGASPVSEYTFGYVDGANESYFVYDVTDESVVTRFQVDVTGQIQFLTWVAAGNEWVLFWSEPKRQCDVYSVCGPFGVCTDNALPSCTCPRGFRERDLAEWLQDDHTAGCARNTALQPCSAAAARDGQKKHGSRNDDRFYTMPNMRLPSNAQSTAAASAHDCELACLRNCSCTAFSYSVGGCSLWYGDLINLQDTTSSGTGGGSSISIRLAASEFSSNGNTKTLIVGLVVGGFVAAVTAIVLATIFILRSRRIKSLRRVEGSLVAFTYRDLRLVTKNFSEKLGGGAFGSVFKGALPDPDATLVAVKKLEGVRQGEKQFRAEVSTIGTTQHVNLIRLLGFCSEGSNRLLVYEHMPNGSLDRHLFGASSSHGVLSWDARYQIALGIARGLDYLHEKCRDCIIHCDIKPENILLDDALVPRVADFGLAKLMGRDFSRVLTTMRGTVGYLAPEWIAGTAVTTKADVFSYGMMLFEIVSGRRNVGQRADGTVDFFPSTAVSLLFDGDVSSAVDGQLGGNADVAQVERACKVACWCVQEDESLRPSMGTVVQVLEGLVDVNVPPIPRSLKVLADPSKYAVEFFSGLPST
ncbi:G-type lectin S-receptor-like serine/threonine-protein kinase At2g19130 isoform X2 [Miscanthus floridulus]|uniref:G-type lectin S-receptor-like serine/threonine-protein kinase At2g19130 isoform X2 n=1 Tax=Miscanthus floridulus TaxID=154761 RepID=UPI00345AC342